MQYFYYKCTGDTAVLHKANDNGLVSFDNKPLPEPMMT